MIVKLDGFGINLEYDNEYSYYTIYSYERIVIHPQSKKYLLFPYKRIINSNNHKYYNFELDKLLCEKGLSCIWNNINEDLSKNNLTFLFSNTNIVLKDELNTLTSIIGTNKKIDIIPNTIIGKIFI